jgi:hypothetical protein
VDETVGVTNFLHEKRKKEKKEVVDIITKTRQIEGK